MRFAGGTAVAAVLLLLAPVPASAGGPTSVVLVSPGRGVAAALYNSDEAYSRLLKLVGDNPVNDPAAPPELQGGPGSDAINVTWLIHDVQVWRVDRVFTDAKDGPWIETVMTLEGGSAFDKPGARHRASDGTELIALLSAMRLLGESPPSANQGAKAPAPEAATVNQQVATVAAREDVANIDWLWALVGAAGGAVLVVGLRPLVRRVRRN